MAVDHSNLEMGQTGLNCHDIADDSCSIAGLPIIRHVTKSPSADRHLNDPLSLFALAHQLLSRLVFAKSLIYKSAKKLLVFV